MKSVDPDEVAHYGLPHWALHCLQMKILFSFFACWGRGGGG